MPIISIHWKVYILVENAMKLIVKAWLKRKFWLNLNANFLTYLHNFADFYKCLMDLLKHIWKSAKLCKYINNIGVQIKLKIFSLTKLLWPFSVRFSTRMYNSWCRKIIDIWKSFHQCTNICGRLHVNNPFIHIKNFGGKFEMAKKYRGQGFVDRDLIVCTLKQMH